LSLKYAFDAFILFSFSAVEHQSSAVDGVYLQHSAKRMVRALRQELSLES
jgi:hypothetical protein